MRHWQVWVFWDPNNNFKKKKGRLSNFFCTFCSKISSTWAMSTTSLKHWSTDSLIFSYKQPEAQRKHIQDHPITPRQWVLREKHENKQKSCTLVDQFKVVTCSFVSGSVRSPAIFLCSYPLNINRLAENWMLSERKGGKTFHLEKYQKFPPSDTSLKAPEGTGCPVGPTAMNRQLEKIPILFLSLPNQQNKTQPTPPHFLLFRKFLNEKLFS